MQYIVRIKRNHICEILSNVPGHAKLSMNVSYRTNKSQVCWNVAAVTGQIDFLSLESDFSDVNKMVMMKILPT